MAFRLTTQERRIVVFLGASLIVGGAVKLAWRPARGDIDVAHEPLVAASVTQPVDLNVAGKDALESLPGIGPTLASRVIAYREEHGPFGSVQDLVGVKGLGPKSVARLGSLVTVEPRSPLDTRAGAGLDR